MDEDQKRNDIWDYLPHSSKYQLIIAILATHSGHWFLTQYTLIEFESASMSPREIEKNGRSGAHGLICQIFVNFCQFWAHIRNQRWKSPYKKVSCLSDNFEIFVIFEILAIFEFFNKHSNESTKNRRKGAHGLNWKIFVNSKIFVIKPV